MDDKFFSLQRESDDVIEMHQRFLNIQKQPLAQGVLVLQIALRLRDHLQESSLMLSMFFFPSHPFLATARDRTLGWTDLYSDSVCLLLCSDCLPQTVSVFPDL